MATNPPALKPLQRRKNDPAGVRARILGAAYELFQKQGFNATSVHEIAKLADVTGGALHHHFPTKQLLGQAVISESVTKAVEDAWLEPVQTAADGRQAILQVFARLADELDAQGSVRGCPVNNLTLELAFANADFRDQLRKLFQRWRQTLADRLGGRDGERLATLVVAAYSGAMAMAKAEQRGHPLRLCASELKRLF